MLMRDRAFSLFGVVIALGILIVSAAALWSDRQEDWARAVRATQNVRVTLADDIARTVRLHDLALQGAADALRTPGFPRAGTALRFRLLFARAETVEHLGSLLVLDHHGNIRYDSLSETPRVGNFSDREYFKVHEARPDVGLYISKPFLSRLRDGTESVAFSRRLFNPDGSFDGVVVGAMKLDYFYEKIRALQLDKGAAIALLRDDGVLIVRNPPLPGELGRDLSLSPNVQRFMREPSGHFVGTALTDGVPRLFNFSRVADLPLIISVGVARDEILASWRAKTWVLAPATLGLCMAVVVLCFLFERELSRRRRAEGELSELAVTDSLTGLANRRHFDLTYEREWLRAWRTQQPISLLFIDADRFKAFNDRYGHAAGDVLLRKIARVLSSAVRDSGDVVARYGGEEFVAMLPDTPRGAALDVAHRIAAAVAALDVDHQGNLWGMATVSVGVACTVPRDAEGAPRLLARADAALYRAKAQGRNRVETAD